MNSKLSRFLSFLFVKDYNCIVCGRELPRPSRYLTCNDCYVKMEIVDDRFCLKCGRKLHGEEDYCLDCQNNEMRFDRAFSPVVYAGAAANLVMNLKFHNMRYLAEPMAAYMTDRFLKEGVAADVVMPVPLHPKRKKERGYNQSELLAKEIAKMLGLSLLTDAAERVKDTLPSTKLEGGRKAREENIRNAFVIKNKEAVKNKTVLVVDDVLTTGATASELSHALKKSGAAKAYVLTFASTRERAPVERPQIN